MTSRELVNATLEFRNTDGRIPRQLWYLPWADMNHREMVERIHKEYRDDIVEAPTILKTPTQSRGNSCEVGEYVDDWGCRFINIHQGIIGEVKEALIKDEDWLDADRVHIPEELLDFDDEAVNRFCRNTDQFVLSGCCPRPFEQLQFLRTTEELYMDLMYPPQKMTEFISKMHHFYCRLVEKWAQTEIDGIMFMDDWGSQNNLLINPRIWDKIFRPMYKDYIEIARKYGKKSFMHSDGNTKEIYPRMIDLGLDAFNSQIFCIGLDELEKYRGKITFWGEIDRQHILPDGTKEEVTEAVQQVYRKLWKNGGCIAQCEFGPGADPQNVYTVFETWDRLNKAME